VKQLRLLIGLLITLIAVLSAGCGSDHTKPSSTYVYVIDYSKSTTNIRKQEIGQMLAELEAASDDTTVVIYRMGYETQEIFSGQLGDAGTDTLLGTLKRDVVTSDPVLGTNFAKMATALVAFSKDFKGSSYNLRIMTDGANDFSDAKDVHIYHEGAATLAHDQRLQSLRIYGVLPEFRQEIRQAFGAAGAKLQIINEDQSLDF
jgi:hypothetical protein